MAQLLRNSKYFIGAKRFNFYEYMKLKPKIKQAKTALPRSIVTEAQQSFLF